MTAPNRRTRRARRLAAELELARRRLRPSAATAASLASAALVGLTPAPAGATVTSSVAANILTVNSDAASDRITIICGGSGNVRINGQNPGTGPFPCADLDQIHVNGQGGSDTIDLSAVGPTDFGGVVFVDIDGGAGRDRIRSSDIDDGNVIGGDAADTVLCGLGCDCVIGALGDDSLVGGSDPDDFDAGPGDDTVMARGGNDDYLYGQEGNDLLDGGPGGDLFFSGGTGNDTVLGGAGPDDEVHGDEDRDRVIGGPGGDWVLGDYHGDTVLGGGGPDQICGDECAIGSPQGPDLLSGGLDGDTVFAEGGVDHLREAGNFNIRIESGAASTVSGGGGQTFLSEAVERITLVGGPSGNRIAAEDYEFGGVTLIGRGGDDLLIGGPQRDRLIAQAGDDRLQAEDGERDLVSGGAGFDRAAVDGSDAVRGVEQRT